MLWYTKLKSGLSYLILEKISKRLYDFLEINIVRKSSYIVMWLYNHTLTAKSRLYYIRVNSSLYKEIYLTDFLSFFLKYSDEFFTYYLTLFFRLAYTCKLWVESVCRIYSDKVQLIVAVRSEYSLNLITFIFSEKSMVNKYTGKVFTYRLAEHYCCNWWVNTTWKCTKHLTVAYLFFNCLYTVFYKGIHLPVTFTFADIFYKVSKHYMSILWMQNFRMELYTIEILCCILIWGYRAVITMWCNLKSFTKFTYIVCMAHPHNAFLRYILK